MLNLLLGGATYFINLLNIDVADVFRMTQSFKCTNNYVNYFRCFEDGGPIFLANPVCNI